MKNSIKILGIIMLFCLVSVVWSATQTFEFTSPGDYTIDWDSIPTAAFNIRITEVTLIGGGGAGGYGGPGPALFWGGGGGGGGGSGYVTIQNDLELNKFKTYSVTIGGGGNSPSEGQASLFKVNNITVYTANGGQGGQNANYANHGNGSAGYNNGSNGTDGGMFNINGTGGTGGAGYLSYGAGGKGGDGSLFGLAPIPGNTGGSGYARIVISYEVSGSAKDEQIFAASNNIVLTGTNFSRTAADDGILDTQIGIYEINGLVQEEASFNASALGNYSSNVYKGLIPGQIYSVEVMTLSRGNDTKDGDILQVAVTLNDQGLDTWSKNQLVTINIYPWQLVGMTVTVNPTGAFTYERATLDATLSLVESSTRIITSYNAFEDAYLGGTYEGKGVYGGTNTLLENTFILEAQGFSLAILNRGVTVSAPVDYNGAAVSSANIVPGCKVTYIVVIKNNNTSIATSVNLNDVIPVNCHLYYTEAPTVEGTTLWDWKGAEDNTADHDTPDAVKFEITIPAEGTVTASYTVTVD